MKHGSQQRFSIRKYSFGAASVLIASLTFLGSQVQADSLTETKTSTEASSQTEFQVTTQTASESVEATSQVEGESVTTATSSSQQEEVSNEKATPSSETIATAETQNSSSRPGVTYSSTSGQSVGSTYMSRAATAGSPTLASLPDSGTYVFEESADVHTQPRLASSVVATYQKGQSVRYDRIVSEDERLWLSYIGGSGARRYVALPAQNNSGQTTDSAVANTLNALAPQGTYTFSKTAGVKNEARIASPNVATYSPGQSVRYDRVLTADNYRWISYISYSGARRYVAVGELAQPTKPVAPEVKVEKTGKVSTSNVSSQGYEIQVSNVQHPDGVKEVLVPSWSEKNGQDDLIWHKAAKQSDGSYKVRIESSQHKNDSGAYHSHVYYVTNQNKREYVTATKVTVPEKPVVQKTGQVSMSNVSTSGFNVVVKNVNHPDGVKEVLVPTWSEKNGQDDLIWHKAAKQSDGSYKARIESSQHKNDSGTYHTHVYYVTNQNKREFVTGTKVTVPEKPVVQKTGQVSMSNVSASGFDVVVKNVNHPNGVKEVLVPSWSEKNGQDDIIWHKAVKQSDGTYKVRIESSQHKNDSGAYQSHVYYVTNQNKREYVTETKVIIPSRQVVQKTGQITASNVSATGFDVVVKNVNHPAGVKEVLVPSWSEKNGQDDIIWHKAVKQNDGSYKVRIESSQHKNDSGAYQSHVYYVTNQNKREYVTEIKVTVPEKAVVQKSGQVSTLNVSASGFDVVVKNVNHPAGVKEVLVPSWSEKNGQDDIIWHKAVKQSDGSYKVRIESSQHKNDSGAYQSHVYYVTDQNKREYVTETKVTVPEKITTVSRPIPHNLPSKGSYTFTKRSEVKNEPIITSPSLAVYEVGNKVNYDRIVTTNGYHWLSYISYTGQRRYVAYGPSHTLEEKKEETQGNQSTSGKGLPEKWVGNKKYSGTVTHIDDNPVYSDKNRVTIDRIVIHHNAGMSDEGARATWYIRNGNETSAHYQVTPDKIWGVVPENEVAWHAGHYPTNQRSIGIEHLNNSLGPHWTIAEATYRNSAKLIADISIRYNIPLDRNHVIGHEEVSATLCPGGIDMDKLLTLAKAERAKLEKTTLPNTSAVPTPQTPRKVEVPYYSQLDSRWASKRYGNYLFGPTGCVPTSLAMVFTGLSGNTVLPTQVGDYIYNNTSAFNKLGPGTATNGIVKAIDKWGYKHEVLKSAEAIKNSLVAGNPVLLAVGASVFVNYPSTHEIVLSEYQNGKVKVSDPYTKSLSGWHSLDYLWNVRSRVAEDNELGSPAIAVKRV